MAGVNALELDLKYVSVLSELFTEQTTYAKRHYATIPKGDVDRRLFVAALRTGSFWYLALVPCQQPCLSRAAEWRARPIDHVPVLSSAFAWLLCGPED